MMRTVIIASQQHIDWINRYHMFLEPFLKKDLKLCGWKQDGQTIDEIIPSVYDCIGGSKEWKAVILFDEKESRSQINPFDVIAKNDGSVEGKKDSYDHAIEKPLTKLCTYLCSFPVETDSEHIEMKSETDIDQTSDKSPIVQKTEQNEAREFNEYKDASNHKKKLRDNFLKNNGVLKANLPKEVHCVALRTIVDECTTSKDQINLAWDSSTDVMYSDFGDRNMYFDRMRYFVCDILPDNHVNYKFNYLEFVYTLLVFAGNHVPNDAVQPNRLYCIESDCSEQRLKTLLEEYDQKLENTVHHILREKEEIESSFPGPMSDEQAEKTFHSKTVIPVMINSAFNMEGFYADKNEFSKLQGKYEKEWLAWGNMYHTSDDVMHRLMKQSRRSLEKSTNEFRRTNKEDSLRALGLNHFQLDDLQEYSEIQEDKMMEVQTSDFYDLERYEEEMSKQNEHIKDAIASHMSKKSALTLGAFSLLAFAVGFVPVLFFNRKATSAILPFVLLGVSLAILLTVGLIRLALMRDPIKDAVDKYNNIMKGIKKDVDDSMNRFSDFLSYACRAMKCNYVLNELRKKDNIFKQRIRILHGHMRQIREKQIELRGLFGEYVGDHPNVNSGEYYKYNFDKVTEYEYPIPFDEHAEKTIFFLEEGHTAVIPYDFISSVNLRMEELYER